jgi:hypothetical protein
MATITTRAGKGSPLTNSEVDSNFTNINTELGQKESASNKGVANGYASLDGSGKVPSTQLPSYVDDVVEGANLAALPGTGETGKIYVTLDTNKTYRWSGSAYVEISASPGSTDAVPEGSTNLYFTNARARSAISASGSLSYNSSTGVMSFSDAVTSVAGRTGAVTLTSSDVGLGNVENKSSATIRGEITSGNVTTALGYTPANSTSLSSYLPLSGGTVTGQVTFGNTESHWTGPLTYFRSNNQFNFLTISGNAQAGRFAGIQVGTTYSGTVPNDGILFGTDTQLVRSAANQLTLGGDVVLDAGNYNSYSPTLTGGGASGTWGISINGNAATVTSGLYSSGTNSVPAAITFNTTADNWMWLYRASAGNDWYSGPTTANFGIGANRYAFSSSGSSPQAELILERGTTKLLEVLQANLQYKGSIVLHAGNYSSYALPLSGGTVTGQTYISTSGYPLQLISTQRYGLQVRNSNNSANANYGWWLAHDANSNFALHADGIGDILTVGRNGSFTVNGNTVLHAGNYSGYSSFSGRVSGTEMIAPKFGILDGPIDCYMEVTDQNPTYLGDAYGGEFYFYGDQSRVASLLYVGGIDVSRSLQAGSSLRAPIFYDSSNTGYYADPAATSNFNELNVSGYAVRNVISISVTAGNWYTVATNSGNRSYATFYVWDVESGRHGSMSFNAGLSYGSVGTITMLGKSWYSGGGIFNDIRIRGSSTYDTQYLQIYVNTSGTLYVAMESNYQSSGWTLTNSGGTGSPGTTTFAEVDPNSYRGLATNGSIYSGGDIVSGSNSFGLSSVRAPLFYDYNDTGYYIDPNSTSLMYQARFVQRIAVGNGTAPFLNTGTAGIWFSNAGGASHFIGSHDSDTSWWGIYTNGAWRAYLDGSSNWFALGSTRSPIFYDYNNTGYYVDAASTSVFNAVLAASGGFYDASHGNDPYGKLSVTRNPNANYAYIGLTRAGQIGSGIGIDTGNNLWWGGTNAGYDATRTSTWFYCSSGGDLCGTSSVRGPIFYDSNDTGYYCDPNSSSRLNTATFGNGSYTDIILLDDESPNGRKYIHANSNLVGFLSGGGSWISYTDNSGNFWATASSRSPIFYDNNDTGYYIDSNSTSRVNDIRPTKITRAAHAQGFLEGSYNNVGGNSSYTNPIYTIGSAYNPTDSSLSNMYGIGYAHPNLWGGGNRTSDWGLYVVAGGVIDVTLGQGATTAWFRNIAYADGSFRSPIFYDSNDTSYYLNPNGTSVLNAVNYWGVQFWNGDGVYARGTNTYGYRFNNYADTINAFIIDNSGNTTSYASSRAPIFYDSNNTGYYIDPSAGGNVQGNWEFSSTNNSSTSYSVAAIELRESNAGGSSSYLAPRLGFHWGGVVASQISIENSGRISILNNPGSGYEALIGEILYGSSSVRAPIFYDSNDTSYNLDPSSTSRLYYAIPNKIKCVNHVSNEPRWDFSAYVVEAQHWYGNNSSQTMFLGEGNPVQIPGTPRAPIFYDYNDTGYYTDTNSTSRMADIHANRIGVNQGVNASWPLIVNGNAYLNGGGYGQAEGSWRAPLFYDSENTAYYLNPNGTSRVATLDTDRVTYLSKGYDAVYLGGSGLYQIGYPDTNWWKITTGSTFSLLLSCGWDWDRQVGFHYTPAASGSNGGTLRIGQTSKNSSSYNHTYTYMHMNGADRFYWDWNGVFQAFGDSRAPVFYEYGNTGYYLNLDSTTALRTVGSWRADSASWDGEFSGKIQYHSTNWYFQYAGSALFRNSGGSNVFTIDQSGNAVASGNVTAYSDRRLKSNITSLGSASKYLSMIDAKRFTWNTDGRADIGFIAQDVEEAGLPEFVLETGGYDPNTETQGETVKSLDYGRMVAVLWQAVKEQQSQIEAAVAEIKSLKERLQ